MKLTDPGAYFSRVYSQNPNIITRKIVGETVMVPINNNEGDLNQIHILNGVGSRIWELINGIATIEQITNSIVVQYKVTRQQAESDIIEFLEELEKIHAVSAEPYDK
jgi:hypothetical protein